MVELDMKFELPAEILSLPELKLLDGDLSLSDVLKIGKEVITALGNKNNAVRIAEIKKAGTLEEKQKLAKWLIVGAIDLAPWLKGSPYKKVVDGEVVTLKHKGYGIAFKRVYRGSSATGNIVAKKTTYLPLGI